MVDLVLQLAKVTTLRVALGGVAFIVAASSVGCGAVEGCLAPWCDDISPAGALTNGLGPGTTPDQELIDGLESYGWNQHRDTFAGLWIDQTRGGTVVVHFTDDPSPHRVEAVRLGAAAELGRLSRWCRWTGASVISMRCDLTWRSP